MKEGGVKREQRFDIRYWDGVNSTVQPALSKRTELSHAENARSPVIGVLEKREGQTITGTSPAGNVFVSLDNFGIVRFSTTNSGQQGVFRVSSSSEPTQNLSLEVHEQIFINEPYLDGASLGPSTTTFQTFVIDNVAIDDDDIGFLGVLDQSTITLRNDCRSSNIYYLSVADTWVKLADSDAQNIRGAQCDFTVADKKLVIVNQVSKNRQIDADGATVTTATDAGNLFNSPPASKTCFYKGRIYLADFMRDNIRYPTTVIRSSYASGILALVDGDQASHASGTSLSITDAKYFYTDSGMNSYEVYRGTTLISTITVTAINETSLTVTHSGTPTFNSADEIWITGTYNGAKQFRWVNNPTISGRDVKQYDTFKLGSGEEDPITLFDTIGNVIFIGNRYGLTTWDDYSLVNLDLGIGCASKNGSIKLLGSLYFIHYSGIFATTGSVPTLLSRKVDRYIKGATKEGIENSAAGVKGYSVFFTLGDVTLTKEDGSFDRVLDDVCLEYNIADQNWYVLTGITATDFATFIASDGTERLLETSQNNAMSVMDCLSGNTDDEKEIFFRADTSELQLVKEIESLVNPIGIVAEIQRGAQMKCFIGIDKDDFYEIDGLFKKGVSSLKVNSKDQSKTQPVIAHKIKLSFRDSSKQRCRISQASIVFLPTPMEEPTE